MSNDTTNELPQVSELDTLKARADMLGINYHPKIGVESLRAKIDAKLNDQPDPDEPAEDTAAPVAAVEETEGQRRQRLKREATKLVRINVTCMNPAKREWEGEIFTAGNSMVPTQRKFVPFNTTEGYHVPQIILEMMKARECQIFVSGKTKNGVQTRVAKLIKEFNIEVLPPLSKDELAELARRQAMQAGQTV